MSVTISGSDNLVLQVVNITNSTSYAGTTGAETVVFTASSITPKFATSKIAVFFSVPIGITGTAANFALKGLVRRGSTTSGTLIQSARLGQYQGGGAVARELYITGNFIGLDSPATTSAVSYSFCIANLDQNPNYDINANGSSQIILMEIAG